MNKRKGFTLVEVLVTSIITGFVLAGLGTSLVLGMRIARESNIESSLTNMGNIIQMTIIRDVRVGASVNVVDITSGASVVGRHLTIKDRDGTVGVNYFAYNDNAANNFKNRIFRQVGDAGSIDEMNIVKDTKLDLKIDSIFETNGTWYQVDISLDFTYLRDGEEFQRSNVKNIAVSCRNFRESL